MPVTRSMRGISSLGGTGTTASTTRPQLSSTRTNRRGVKRKAAEDLDTIEPFKTASVSSIKTVGVPTLQHGQNQEANSFLPAVLTFSFESAKEHLSNVDARFRDMFNKLPCRPFEQLERVDPFRTLTTSIIGQQVSWLAARAIIHKFIRLYFPHLPEKLPPANSTSEPKVPQDVFPTATQVAETDITALKSAGLSTRKAEYVRDLASRFADGRLTTQKLLEADDEELFRLLIAVRGIGPWTVDMFAIFSLRRPDILPVGDLGVQRGVLRWFLSLHSPKDTVAISPKKNLRENSNDEQTYKNTPRTSELPTSTLPPQEEIISSIPPIPTTPVKRMTYDALESSSREGVNESEKGQFPEPFTPSINRTLRGETSDGQFMKTPISPLPEGLSVSILKSRLSGKKVAKGAFLTPKEMEELTAPWKPYRSLAVYYMWALAEESSASK